MTKLPKVLFVDDNPGGQEWLLHLVKRHHCECVVATNEQLARQRLEEIQRGEAEYVIAIIDVMIATHSVEELAAIDDAQFEQEYEESRDTGIRLCQYARGELMLSEERLPIIVVTVREQDDHVRVPLQQLKIPVVNRAHPSARGQLEQELTARLKAWAG